MHAGVESYGLADRERAVSELETELTTFNQDALVQLIVDLRAGVVVRGSWNGCVLSYRRGAPGSVQRDRAGRPRNAFTALWDHGWITDEEVCDAATRELARRRKACHGRLTHAPSTGRFSRCAASVAHRQTGL